MTNKSHGQATVEYIFILAFALILGFKFINKFTNFFSESMGGVAHVLSTHVTIGICPQDCFFNGYDNGYVGNP